MMVVYTGVRDSMGTRDEIAEQKCVPFMKRCKDGWMWVEVCGVDDGDKGRGRMGGRKGGVELS